MNNQTSADLTDLVACVESLKVQLSKMTLKVKIDVAARLKAITKAAEAIDAEVKKEIKAKLGNQPGEVVGELFKANLALISVNRLNQKKLEVEYPKVYAKCMETKENERITFEVR